MAEALGRVLGDSELRRTLAASGPEEAARFHPDRVQARIDAFSMSHLSAKEVPTLGDYR